MDVGVLVNRGAENSMLDGVEKNDEFTQDRFSNQVCSNASIQNEEIEIIIAKYSNTVYKLALAKTKNKETAEDIFQEVFIRLIRKKKVFENEDHEKAWIIRVTLNCCKDLWNSAWIRHTVPLEEYQENIAAMSSDENVNRVKSGTNYQTSVITDDSDDVYMAVMDLPDKYRIPIHLFYYEELSIAEIGKILKVKNNTIATQLKRARTILKTKLNDGGWNDGF